MRRIIILVGIVVWAFVAAAAAAPALRVRVKVSAANVRAAAKASAKVLRVAKQGTIFPVVEKLRGWYRVALSAGGMQGFLASADVEEIAESAAAKRGRAPAAKTVSRPAGEAAPPVSVKPFFVRFGYDLGFLENKSAVAFQKEIYYETAEYNLDYVLSKGGSFDAAVGYMFSRSFGVALGANATSRTLEATAGFAIPHPLWMEMPRAGELTPSSLSYSSIDILLHLVGSFAMGPLAVDVSGGLCYMMAKATLVSGLTFSEGSYPYTEITLDSASEAVSGQGFGFHAGLALGYRLGSSLVIYGEARYLSASLKFKAGDDIPETSLSGGGLRAGAGLKILF